MNNLETIVLDNGLTIYLYPDSRRHSIFFQFNTLCGGIHKYFEYDGKEYSLPDGVAHALEHYIVECNPNGNFLTELGERQMSTNASTSYFVTNYYFETVLDVCFGIRTLLEGIHHVTFSSERLQKLKNPICQEIRGRFDNKFYHASRRRMENLFPGMDFRDVGGTIDEVLQIKIEDLEVLYQAFYQPKNQFIVVAGAFSKEEVLNEITSFYNTYHKEYKEVVVLPYPRDLKVQKTKDTFSFPSPMNYTEISFKIDISGYRNVELLDLDFYLNTFYHSSFGTSSFLYQKLVDEKIIIDSIACSDFMLNNFLIITIGAYTNNPKVFQKEVLQEVKSLKHFNKEEFEMDQKSSIVQLKLRDENIFKMIFPFIHNIVYYHYPYLDQVEDVLKLTYDGYVEEISKLNFCNYSILTIEKE